MSIKLKLGKAVRRLTKDSRSSSGPAADQLRNRLAVFGFGGALFAALRLVIDTWTACGCWEDVYTLFFMNPRPIYVTTHAVVVFGLVGLAARFSDFGRKGLQWLDAGGFLLIVGAPAWVSHAVGFDGYVQTVLVFGAMLMTTWRAAIIPSHPTRTALLSGGAVILSQLPAWIWAREQAAAILPYPSRVSWLAITCIIAAVISRIIYRLDRQSRAAEALGQYRLEKKLGGGGMGDVYLARHALMCRPVALKVLRPDTRDDSSVERFDREVRLTSALKHPNTITIYDFGQSEDGEFFYVMEHLDGYDLKQIVDAAGALSPARALHIIRQAAGSLTEAHQQGLIHRDIKPANIFLSAQGGLYDFVKVLDFGLVKSVQSSTDAALTQEASVLGTPLFLSPEAIKGDPVDERSDIYALGCVAWNLLSGRCLFDGGSVVEVLSRHLHQAPKRPSEVGGALDMAEDFESVVMACLEKDPAKRPASMAILQEMLAHCDDADCWSQELAQAAFESDLKRVATREEDTLQSEEFISILGKDLTIPVSRS